LAFKRAVELAPRSEQPTMTFLIEVDGVMVVAVGPEQAWRCRNNSKAQSSLTHWRGFDADRHDQAVICQKYIRIPLDAFLRPRRSRLSRVAG